MEEVNGANHTNYIISHTSFCPFGYSCNTSAGSRSKTGR